MVQLARVFIINAIVVVVSLVVVSQCEEIGIIELVKIDCSYSVTTRQRNNNE